MSATEGQGATSRMSQKIGQEKPPGVSEGQGQISADKSGVGGGGIRPHKALLQYNCQ